MGNALAMLPDVFLPYQQRFANAVDSYSVVVEEKSRRTGFSWAAALVAVLRASTVKAAGGMDVLYMGYNLEMAREFIDYVAEWARAIEPAAQDVEEYVFVDPEHPEKSVQAFRVKFASGFKVLALPSTPRALRGMQGLVIIDEAAFHDDLEALLKSAFALLIWGGKVVIISTHNGETNPFNVLVQDIRAGRRPYHLGRTTFDEALGEGLYQRICLTTGKVWTAEAEKAWRADIIAFYGDAADEELFVIPSASSGSFLPGPLIEARMVADVPVLRWECPDAFGMWAEHLRQAECADWCERELMPVLATLDPKTPHCFGADIARKGDLWVLWVLAIGRDLVRRTPFTIELRNIPFAQQRQILWFVLNRLPLLRAGMMDATGLGMQIAEETTQKFGARVVGVMLNDSWYRENMPAWKAAFEDAMITLPRDRDILTDHRAIGLVRGIAKVIERSGDAGKKRHGDSAIASALAYAASRSEPEIYEYQSASREAAKASAWRDRPDEDEDDRQVASDGILPSLRGGIVG
jgi:phage FluMu gp28-like protein